MARAYAFGNMLIASNETVFGKTWFVDTLATRTGSGKIGDRPFSTMEEALAAVGSNDVIYARGTITEQLTAPLGVYGVKIIGAVGGNARHDQGIRWKEEATAANAPLITIREQGWEFRNILFVPETGYSAIKAHRAESATYPDSSHFKVRQCKFIGNVAPGSFGGIGIEDYGGNHHYVVEDCEFNDLVSCITATNVSIASPLRNVIQRNLFRSNKNDITFNGSQCLIYQNIFCDVYHGTNHPNTVNLAFTADASGYNRVLENHFGDASANITIAKGFKPSTGDMWRNWSTNAADPIVAVPS